MQAKDAEATCLLFVDGLRFDCAKRLAAALEEAGCAVEESIRWAALPSVTGTGKPAVAPLPVKPDQVGEEPAGYNFELVTAYHLRKVIEENGYTVPEKNIRTCPTPATAARLWMEFGDIDHEGHDRGWKLAKHIDALLAEIRNRITELLAAGWKSVRVVTDHGWLLVPGGLPKIDLPSVLVDSKWGRCASLKPGASCRTTAVPLVLESEPVFRPCRWRELLQKRRRVQPRRTEPARMFDPPLDGVGWRIRKGGNGRVHRRGVERFALHRGCGWRFLRIVRRCAQAGWERLLQRGCWYQGPQKTTEQPPWWSKMKIWRDKRLWWF